MSVFNFYLPGNFGITQDAELYIMNESSLGIRQYHFKILCGSNLNSLFNTRTYIQNSSNQEKVDINLSINQTFVNSVLMNVYNAPGGAGSDESAYRGMDQGILSFSERLLEIAALKIFRHAKARAAIANDNDFTNLYSNVTTHLLNSFMNEDIKLNFFEQYIGSRGLLNNGLPSDTNESVDFNLHKTQIFIYGTFNGYVTDITPATAFGGFPPNANYSTNIRLELQGFDS